MTVHVPMSVSRIVLSTAPTPSLRCNNRAWKWPKPTPQPSSASARPLWPAARRSRTCCSTRFVPQPFTQFHETLVLPMKTCCYTSITAQPFTPFHETTETARVPPIKTCCFNPHSSSLTRASPPMPPTPLLPHTCSPTLAPSPLLYQAAKDAELQRREVRPPPHRLNDPLPHADPSPTPLTHTTHRLDDPPSQ